VFRVGAIALLVSTPTAMSAQQGALEMNGTWELEFSAPWGVVVWTFELEQAGDVLTGESVLGMGTLVLDGSVSGHDMDFVVDLADGPHALTIEFTGMADPDMIGGEVMFEDGSVSEWTFVRGEPAERQK
jgi:hypothetical protein